VMFLSSCELTKSTVGETWKLSHIFWNIRSISTTEPRPDAVNGVPFPAMPVGITLT